MIDEKKLIEKSIYYPSPVSSYKAGWNDCNRDWMKRIDSQPKVGEWIPVSERLPDSIEDVLVTVTGQYGNIIFDNAVLIGSYSSDEDDGWWIEAYSEWKAPIVTAWQPLPEAYEEKEL